MMKIYISLIGLFYCCTVGATPAKVLSVGEVSYGAIVEKKNPPLTFEGYSPGEAILWRSNLYDSVVVPQRQPWSEAEEELLSQGAGDYLYNYMEAVAAWHTDAQTYGEQKRKRIAREKQIVGEKLIEKECVDAARVNLLVRQPALDRRLRGIAVQGGCLNRHVVRLFLFIHATHYESGIDPQGLERAETLFEWLKRPFDDECGDMVDLESLENVLNQIR